MRVAASPLRADQNGPGRFVGWGPSASESSLRATILRPTDPGLLRAQAPAALDAHDLVWRSPSRDASGSMPIGNGEVGCNVWVTADGVLHALVSRTDSFSEASRLLKLGSFEVQVRRPVDGDAFEQRLCLRDGCIRVTFGEGERRVSLTLFVDSGADVVHVIGESARPEQLVMSASTWRKSARRLTGEELRSSWTMQDAPAEMVVEESADRAVAQDGAPRHFGFFHHNAGSVVPATLHHQGLDAAADKVRDPLLHRTFGLLLGGDAQPGSIRDPLEPVLITPRGTHFALCIAAPSVQDADPAAWTTRAAALVEAADPQVAATRTAAWWHEFFARSWILAGEKTATSDAVPVNRHPLRVGVDSGGGNRFVGTIADLHITRGGRELYARSAIDLPLIDTDAAALDLAAGFTLHATVQQDPAHPIGRIVDKVTAGGSDGFLFDTHPGHALRLIVGERQLIAAGALPAGEKHEVEARYDAVSARMTILRDGEVVADSGANADPAPPSRLTQALLLQRWVQACGGRGAFPIKFNGSIFTVEPRFAGGPDLNADWRRWGDCFWWQNTRLPYHPMLAQGDFEMMEALFRLFESAVPLAQARAKIWHRVEGVWFPETMTPFGTYANNDYGWDRKGREPNDVQCGYWRWAWNQGPELLALMLDRNDYHSDAGFVRAQLLPMADAVLAYFDSRFPRRDDGTLRITPTQAIETFWFGVEDDLPTVAGLHDVLERLLALPSDQLDGERRARFAKLRAILPPIPTQDVDGVRVIAPAAKYEPRRSNVENPELYAIFPFRRFGLMRDGLDVARATFARRAEKMTQGWTQDGQQAALLGLVAEARDNLLAKVRNANRAFRFPAMWGPNFDWLPDQDHGSNLLMTAQCMLLQPVGRSLLVLPTWPKDWDVAFRLHAPGDTVVEVEYRGGKFERIEVTPKERRADLVLPQH